MIRYADTRQPLHGQHYTEAEIKEIAVLQNSVLEIVPEPKITNPPFCDTVFHYTPTPQPCDCQ